MRSRSARECVGWVVGNGKAAESKSEGRWWRGEGCWLLEFERRSRGNGEGKDEERLSPHARGGRGECVPAEAFSYTPRPLPYVDRSVCKPPRAEP